jgi:putative transposase
MARPLRIEFEHACYHVTSRGNQQAPIFLADQDFELFLEILAQTVQRMNWRINSYVLMNNHYHLVVTTPEANLSRGMRDLNGQYTQAFNRRRSRSGHVFQGRYKAIIVDKDRYLAELARYLTLNPVRAHMVTAPDEWRWSSFHAMVGEIVAPSWLDTSSILGLFSTNELLAQTAFRRFVWEGINSATIWQHLQRQQFLGDQTFVERMASQLELPSQREVPKQARLVRPLAWYVENTASRNEAMVQAHASGGYTFAQLGDFFGLHYATVSRIVKKERLSSQPGSLQ